MSEKKTCRFYRSNLATIVWNPDTNSELANFSEGHFTTSDPKVIEVLRSKGYMEIPLDATSPPEGIVLRQPTHIIEGEVPIVKPGVSDKLADAVIQSKMKTTGQPAAPEVNKQVVEEKPKVDPPSASKPALRKRSPQSRARKKKENS